MSRFLLLAESSRPAESMVAAAAVRRCHPEAHITWLVTDPRPVQLPSTAPGDRVVLASRRRVGGVRHCDIWMATSHHTARWAMLPGVLGELLDADDDPVVVLPAWARLDGPADLLTASTGATFLARHHDPSTGVSWGGVLPEIGGFGPGSRPLLAWWEAAAARLARTVELSPSERDEPWRSMPRSDGVVVSGAGEYRVHPSTVAELDLGLVEETDGVRVEVGGRRLVLASFPSFDPERPYWYVEPGRDAPGVSVGRSAPLRHLTHARAAELMATGDGVSGSVEVLPGVAHTGAMADGFRAELVSSGDAASGPPNPFVAGEVAAFVEWLTAPAGDSPTGVSRAADGVWAARPDLATVFPNVRWGARSNYVRWLWTSGLAERESALALLPDPPTPHHAIGPPERRRFGVNLAGYHQAELGLGVAVRRIGRALDAAEIPWTPVTYDRTSSRQRSTVSHDVDAPFYFNLVLITAEQLPLFIDDVGRGILDGRYTVGLWFWESDAMRQHERHSFELVDEVWGATSYLRDVFAAHTDKPVERIPVPLEFDVPTDVAAARAIAGFDDRFTFLFTFDFLSVAARKNPEGIVEAYRRAFPEPDGTRLVLKSINGDLFAEAREELLDRIGDRPDIELWDRYLSADQRLALVAGADCFVSLHRSEGLGLTMAEAMAAGTPVIASAYSGNLDFMDRDSALLVGGREIPIGPGHYYPAEGHWFDPNLDEAAALMRRVRVEPELRARLREAGPQSIRRFTAGRVGHLIERRLRELWVSGDTPER